MGVLVSAWSYNTLISAWEPILEPWDLILKLDINTSSLVRTAASHAHLHWPGRKQPCASPTRPSFCSFVHHGILELRTPANLCAICSGALV